MRDFIVQYRYASGSANQIRPTRTTYPDGRELNLDYGSAGGQADLLSLVAALVDDDGTTHLTDYSYLGLGAPVITDYAQPDVMYTLVGTAGGNDPDTGDIYRGLDRFGRVKDAYWRDYGASADAARIQYGYDRAGNRTYRADPVAVANSAPYEELYGYDAIQRLKTMDRGTLASSNTSITSKQFAQCWSLDATGNWKGFREDANGDGAWDTVQARTANTVNEITGISNSVGSAWVTPAYNAAGNMTSMPQTNAPGSSYTATYDAWNRLVRLEASGSNVAGYAYDGAKRRIIQQTYTAGVLSETRHFYYTKPAKWQEVEERMGTSPDSASMDRQFVWGLRYIDDLILRDRTGERLYAMQDGNWNISVIGDSSGMSQERYAYSAYGMPIFLTPAFTSRPYSNYAWETGYCSYCWEPSTGLFHVRNRVYISRLGFWGQRDPNGCMPIMTASKNIYAYCNSLPLDYVDPQGLQEAIPLPVSPRLWPRLAPNTNPRPWIPFYPPRPWPIFVPPPFNGGYPRPSVPPIPAPRPKKEKCKRGDMGDCKPEQYRDLNDKVDKECENGEPPNCEGTWLLWVDCDELTDKANRLIRCLQARIDRETTCWRGGDKIHHDIMKRLAGYAETCIEKAQYKGCFDPDPLHVDPTA